MSTRHTLPKLSPTPESAYLNRRDFVKRLGLGALSLSLASHLTGCDAHAAPAADVDAAAAIRPGIARPDILSHFPAKRNPAFNFDTKLTDEIIAATHNNFYEMTVDKDRVWELAQSFQPDPWLLEVSGLCNKPTTFNLDDFFTRFGGEQEERTYHFRCVEAWAMDVPWTGIELNKILKAVDPKSDAKFVRFITMNHPEQMPGIVAQPWYPWPYFEGLRMDEAMHPLALLVTGIYGHPIPRQHGAPFRVIVPWKYGYKSPKSIVKIELVGEQPDTFWEKLQPAEYPFISNVDPAVPHPRWSQATETDIGTGNRRKTLPYNGYAEHVAKLYA